MDKLPWEEFLGVLGSGGRVSALAFQAYSSPSLTVGDLSLLGVDLWLMAARTTFMCVLNEVNIAPETERFRDGEPGELAGGGVGDGTPSPLKLLLSVMVWAFCACVVSWQFESSSAPFSLTGL